MNKLWIAIVALTLGAGFAAAHEGMGHEAAGPVKVVSGELVDMDCYLGHAAKGEKHAACALACAKGGAPMGLLTPAGKLYLVVADHADEKPYAAAKAMAGSNAKLSGRVVNSGGVQALIVSKAEKL